jgi:hypothetical protein
LGQILLQQALQKDLQQVHSPLQPCLVHSMAAPLMVQADLHAQHHQHHQWLAEVLPLVVLVQVYRGTSSLVLVFLARDLLSKIAYHGRNLGQEHLAGALALCSLLAPSRLQNEGSHSL